MDTESEYYDEKEVMPPEERERCQQEKLKHIIEHAYQNAPAVKDKLRQAGVTPGDIQTIKDLEKIPITRKDELIELQKASPPFGGFLACDYRDTKGIFVSPGPINDPHGNSFDYWNGARVFYAVGFRKGDLVLITLSYHLAPGGMIIHDNMQALGAVPIPGGVGNTELQVKVLHDLKVTGYIGTSSGLVALIKRAEAMGYKDFHKEFALKRAACGGEMLPPSLRHTFEQDYGITATQFYTTADLGHVAYECREKSGMHFVEEVIVEIVDPDTGKQVGPGEEGEVVVTPFNEIYPLIRFGTGDLASYTDEPCPCGRTSKRVLGIWGRVGGAIKVRGMFVHPDQVGEVAGKFPQIRKFQLVIDRQAGRDDLTFKAGVADEIDKDKLWQDFEKSFREICRVRVDRMEFVPKGAIPEDAKAMLDKRSSE